MKSSLICNITMLLLYMKEEDKEDKYLAHKGKQFEIQWYFNEADKSQANEYFDNKGKIRTLKLFERMGEYGEIRDKTKFRSEGDQIYAFKPKPDRFLSFFTIGKVIILTNAFKKKTKKLPPSEKAKALRALEDYKDRLIKNEYYEKELVLTIS